MGPYPLITPPSEVDRKDLIPERSRPGCPVPGGGLTRTFLEVLQELALAASGYHLREASQGDGVPCKPMLAGSLAPTWASVVGPRDLLLSLAVCWGLGEKHFMQTHRLFPLTVASQAQLLVTAV